MLYFVFCFGFFFFGLGFLFLFFGGFFFPQITKVCLQGMVSKNKKHSATFNIALLASSLNLPKSHHLYGTAAG